jgi:GAF domain-containing protein
VEPIPPTSEALEKLDRLGETGVAAALDHVSAMVRDVVPECVGLSLTLVDEDITLTMVSEGAATLALDAMQYLDGGPCVLAAETNQRVDINEADLFDEDRWSMFALASAAAGVQSSLSLPLLDDDHERVVGGVNLYGSRRNAFDGHHDVLAGILGAWAPGVVRDADLSFSTRRRAAEAPGVLADHADVDVAVRVIATAQEVDADTARLRLRESAARAGISEAEVARTVIRTHLE